MKSLGNGFRQFGRIFTLRRRRSLPPSSWPVTAPLNGGLVGRFVGSPVRPHERRLRVVTCQGGLCSVQPCPALVQQLSRAVVKIVQTKDAPTSTWVSPAVADLLTSTLAPASGAVVLGLLFGLVSFPLYATTEGQVAFDIAGRNICRAWPPGSLGHLSRSWHRKVTVGRSPGLLQRR